MPLARLAPLLVAIAATLPTVARAQGTPADYERADSMRERFRGKVFRDRVAPHWTADGDRFWYVNHLTDGVKEFILVDATRGERRPAFDPAKLADTP